MPQIGVTKETKTKLLSDAQNGLGIDGWLFQFIRHDPEFQGELFRTAENAQNWRFLECLCQYREQERRTAFERLGQSRIPPRKVVSTQLKSRSKPTESRSKNRKPPKGIKPTPHQPRHDKRKTTPAQISGPPIDPKTLPPDKVIRVQSNAFTLCSKCGIRLLKTVLNDHLELSCPHRGRIEGPLVNLSSETQKVGVNIVYCRCGVPAIPGDVACYDHKHT